MQISCPVAVPGVANAATVSDFVLAFTLVETVELSNLDSGGSAVDCERVNKALRDAYAQLQAARQLLLVEAARAAVDANLNRWMLIIARYYLDTVRRRADVLADYREVLAQLAKLQETKQPSAATGGAELPVWHYEGKQPVFTQRSNYGQHTI